MGLAVCMSTDELMLPRSSAGKPRSRIEQSASEPTNKPRVSVRVMRHLRSFIYGFRVSLFTI